ncbi:MAG TPA: glycosyltransferase family 87 protein [Candidatus Dormibacteraeota bacterium]|nr:glycosyltransferase family 87 protein [Candidatus Dormibacteraeota bacterium]
MSAQSTRWRNLGVAAGAATAVLFAAFDLYQWIAAYAADHFHNDFTFYLAAARIGLAHGWPSIYDLHLQQAELDAMGSGITIAQLARYISPPPVAWLAVPLTPLPYPVAYWTWSALLLAALVAAWLWAAPDAGRARVIYLLAAVGWLPVIYGLQLGQPGLIVAAAVAGSYALLKANHPWWAGITLGAIVLKPQLAFLLPLALVAARQYRAFAGSAIALGGLGLVSIIALGPSGVAAYVDRLDFASNVPVNQAMTLGFRPAQVFIAAWTMLMVYRLRGRGVEWAYACALVGGMLATPYVHLDDLAMLGLAGWFVLRSDAPRWSWIYILAGVVAIEGEPFWGPLPVIAGELGALALFSAAALRSRDGLTLPQIDARPLELRPKQ